MSDFNRVILIGRVGNEIELKKSANGTSYLRISLATNSYKKGQEKVVTHWHRVMVFHTQAETCALYLAKGSTIMVEGTLETGSYIDKDDKKVTTVSVLASRVRFLSRKKSSPELAEAEAASEVAVGY